jgi:hypothetical protein
MKIYIFSCYLLVDDILAGLCHKLINNEICRLMAFWAGVRILGSMKPCER